MNIMSLVAPLVTLGIPVVIGTRFLITHEQRVYRLRSVFQRISLQLTSDQRISHDHTQLDDCRQLLEKDIDCVTAMEFLDDCTRGRGLIDRLDELAASLFSARIVTRMGLAIGGAFIFAPLLLAAAASTSPFAQWFLGLAKEGGISLAVLVAGAALWGVVVTFGLFLWVWKVYFWKDAEKVLLLAEEHPFWNLGKGRRPGQRKIIPAEEDAMYKALSARR